MREFYSGSLSMMPLPSYPRVAHSLDSGQSRTPERRADSSELRPAGGRSSVPMFRHRQYIGWYRCRIAGRWILARV